MFSLVSFVLCLAHVFSCLFQGLAVIEKAYNLADTTWFDKLNINDSEWIIKYIYFSFFFFIYY